MPIDQIKIRRITEHNDQVTDTLKSLTKRLEKLDPRYCLETSITAKEWARNVCGLKISFEEQQELSRDMRENARIQDERHDEEERDKYRFLVDRLKDDIRHFFTSLPEFFELALDFTHQRTWDHCLYDMEMDMKSLSATTAGENIVINVDLIVMLLNYRDRVIALLLNGLLWQKAVLDWDLKNERAYADGPMVEMAEQVVNTVSKTESLPAKYRLVDLESSHEQGPFTLDLKKKQNERADTNELSPLQCRLLTVLREMQSLDKGLRAKQQGEKVHFRSGKNEASDELRAELKKWFDKCAKLKHELELGKEKRHTALEVQVEQLTAKCNEKDHQNKQHTNRELKLLGELQSLRIEQMNLRREKTQLAERIHEIARDHLPVLDKIDKLQSKSREALEQLPANAEILSSVFRLQVQENKKIIEERDEIAKELKKVEKQLQVERLKNHDKEAELQKKETLYLRTMAARKSIHESFLQQKTKILEAEEIMRQKEADWQEMLKVIEGRDSEIKQLNDDLSRARQRIDELKMQKLMCMEEFRKITGRPCNMLIKHFNAVPTLPLAPGE